MQKRLLDFIKLKRLIFTVIVNRSLHYQELLHYCNIRTGHPNHVQIIQLILLISLKSWNVSNVKQEIMQLQYTAGMLRCRCIMVWKTKYIYIPEH